MLLVHCNRVSYDVLASGRRTTFSYRKVAKHGPFWRGPSSNLLKLLPEQIDQQWNEEIDVSSQVEHAEKHFMFSVVKSSCTVLIVDEIKLLPENELREDISRSSPVNEPNSSISKNDFVRWDIVSPKSYLR